MPEIQQITLPAGYELGSYRVLSVLPGLGGMFGTTYLAEDNSTNSIVAIKEYLPRSIARRAKDDTSVEPEIEEYRADYEYGLQKFREEAAKLAGFHHPNVVAIRDYIEANKTTYLVMEYIVGETLQERLESRWTLPESEIRQILDPILNALEAVHESGFLHSNIKPAHILIQEDGVPILIDFGSARSAFGTKHLAGIVAERYAPFEQYMSQGKQGPWTDIYAMGAVVYRCVMGVVPPESPLRIMDDPYVGVTTDGYSAALQTAIDIALKVWPDERPQSVADWRSVLDGR